MNRVSECSISKLQINFFCIFSRMASVKGLFYSLNVRAAWTAYVDAARSRRLLPRKCPSATAVAGYLHRACAPGADDSVHNPNSDSGTRTALCALCPGACSVF